jgi:hypothetical protein
MLLPPARPQGKTRALALLSWAGPEQLLASLHTHASQSPDRIIIRDKGLRPKVKACRPAARPLLPLAFALQQLPARPAAAAPRQAAPAALARP